MLKVTELASLSVLLLLVVVFLHTGYGYLRFYPGIENII